MLKTALAVALVLGAASGAYAKTLKGPYTISFTNDPGASPGSQICLTLATADGIAGFPESGTFVDTDGEGISGQYVVDGKYLHLMMLVTGYGDNVDAIGLVRGRTAAGNYDDFDSGYNGGANTDISSGTFTLAPGCTEAAQRRHPKQHSVTR